jgi:DNA-binding Lrp family transcriptional regulator
VLGEAMLDMKRALILVRTSTKVSISTFSRSLAKHPGIFRILSLINGDFLLVTMYPEHQGPKDLQSYIQSLKGVTETKVYPIYRSESCILKGKKTRLTPIQLKVLSCLVLDAKMSVSEISRSIGLPSRKVDSVINELQENRGVIFSVRWKPNMGRGLAFILRITYKQSEVDILSFNDCIVKQFPSEFWYSYLPENEPEVFSIFLVDGISDVCRITEEAKKMEYVTSVETMVYYSATVLDPPTRVKLIEMLQDEGHIQDMAPRICLDTDLII